ncbi:hypothetical protein PV350_39770, partial [Streptomyces sp. PA03-6a]|nr:hypothetical protein [Streptomyces sp. PA03-6a]
MAEPRVAGAVEDAEPFAPVLQAAAATRAYHHQVAGCADDLQSARCLDVLPGQQPPQEVLDRVAGPGGLQ